MLKGDLRERAVGRPVPRAEHFTKPYPADTLLEVSSLAQPEGQIEIDAIALAH